MSRPVVLSNGSMHVGINQFGLVHDLYFPYVGLENHAAGKNLRNRIGVWIDGQINWLDDGDWQLTFDYHDRALIGKIKARHDALQILLEFDDFVDTDFNAFIRNIHVINLADSDRQIKLFMHQAFVVGDSRSQTDTAQYLPDSDAILHYRGPRAFVVGGQSEGRAFDQFTTGLFGDDEHEGSYRDADDGQLSRNLVEHGRVDSVIGFDLDTPRHSSKRVQYWVAAGTSIREAVDVHKQVSDQFIISRLTKTSEWWRKWLDTSSHVTDKIPANHRGNFIKSLMIIKSQIDRNGAIMASTDSTMLNYSRDAYAYCWPRDGAQVVWPLMRLGYTEEPRNFFDFCRKGLHPSGYLMHKYRADGALGSSWHPYVHEGGVIAPPIQTDETALTLFVFAQFYQLHGDKQMLEEFYSSLVKPMALFLADYIDETTGLPKASYDLWEEKFLTTTYTTAVTYAALQAAAGLAEIYEDANSAVAWRSSAEGIKLAAHKHLFNQDRQAFYKGLLVRDDKIEYDQTIDSSSVFGAFMFGLFAIDSLEVKSAIETTKQVLGDTLPSGATRLPRYENDSYHRRDEQAKSNWWPVTTMWLAQYHSEANQLQAALATLDWVKTITSSSGIIAEQISPSDGSNLSVAPLTWSHAEYIATLLDMINRDFDHETQLQ